MSEQLDDWICAEFANLAQVLCDYDEYLRLEMTPLNEWDKLYDKSKVFRVVDTRNNKVVLFADSLANPQEILARVWGMDQKNGNPFENLLIQERAQQALQMSKWLEEKEKLKDFSLFIFKNEKNYWHHEGRKRDAEFNDLGPLRKYFV